MRRKSGPTSQHLTADSRIAFTAPRRLSTPPTDSLQPERKASPGPPLPPKTPENLPSSLRPLGSHNFALPRSFSQPLPPLTNSDKLTAAPPLRQHAATQPSVQKPAGNVWDDLISLQEPSQSSSLPLQYSPVSPGVSFPSQPQPSVQQPPPTLGNAPNPFFNLSLGQASVNTPVIASQVPISAPGPQYPFAHSAPLPSPGLHFGATNPFNHGPLPASATGTTFAVGSNPFSAAPMGMSMAASAPATPAASAQQMMALGMGLLHTPPLPYVTSHASTPGLAPNPFAPAAVGAPPGQVPVTSAGGGTNPFSAMQMGQGGFSGTGTPQSAFGTTAFLSQQQQQQQLQLGGFNGWAGRGAHGTF